MSELNFLGQQCRILDNGLTLDPACFKGDLNRPSSDCKSLILRLRLICLIEEVPANFVPAVAVTRGGRALFVMTGRKVRVDG